VVVDAAGLIDWLLDSDPALRWQVERDLAGAPQEVWESTRARIAAEGLGARLLALQDRDGQWAGGAFFPGDFDFHGPEAAAGAGQPWTATTWTLNALRDWGLDARVLAGTAGLLAANSHWEYQGLPYWGGEVDCCINAYTLANGAWLGADVSSLAGWFPGLDPVSPCATPFGVPDVFEDAAVVLDCLRRGGVAGCADDQHLV
jgi:hypothetical protein